METGFIDFGTVEVNPSNTMETMETGFVDLTTGMQTVKSTMETGFVDLTTTGWQNFSGNMEAGLMEF